MNEHEHDHDLRDALAGLVDPLPPPAALAGSTVARGTRRRRLKLAGSGAAGALALTGVALLALPSGTPDTVSPPATSAPSTVPSAVPSAVPSPAPTAVPAAPAVVVLDPEGLAFSDGSGALRRLTFAETAPDVLLAALEDALGQGVRGALPDCSATYEQVTYGRLVVVLEEGRFVGWQDTSSGAERRTTADGIGVGSTLAELRAAFAGVEVTTGSLGAEWSTGGLFGLLDGSAETAEVTSISAGRVCSFR